jgi:hypothetical protein
MRDYMVNGARRNMMPVSLVSRVIVKAVSRKNPKNHYVVSRARFRDWILLHLIPEPVVDNLISTKLGFRQMASSQSDKPAAE